MERQNLELDMEELFNNLYIREEAMKNFKPKLREFLDIYKKRDTIKKNKKGSQKKIYHEDLDRQATLAEHFWEDGQKIDRVLHVRGIVQKGCDKVR